MTKTCNCKPTNIIPEFKCVFPKGVHWQIILEQPVPERAQTLVWDQELHISEKFKKTSGISVDVENFKGGGGGGGGHDM